MNEEPPPTAGTAPDMPDAGRVVGGRYRLEALLGRGGMATVWRARDASLDRPVAVKLLRPEILADPDLALRFRREAHAATVLRHPNVVACLDTGRDGDQPYLVMELVEGEDLASRLRRDGALPQADALRIATDVARGLAVAHARGVVHRDVKPGNILLGADGRARVTDFGIARLAAEAEAALPGTTLGSVHYFSPEQARGATTTPASDVYGLGLVLFEMLTGTRAFGGSTPTEIALARVEAPAPSARAVNPAVTPALDAIVRRATAPQPADRYPNAGALAADLEALARPADSTSPTTIVTTGGPAALPGPPSSAASPAGTAARRTEAAHRRAPAGRDGPGLAVPSLLLVAIVLGVAGAAGAFLLGGGPGLAVESPGGVAEIDPTDPPPGTPAAEEPATSAPEDPATGGPATDLPTPRTGADGTADLCEAAGSDTCSLGAAVYAPSRFAPAVQFAVADGWSTFLHQPGIVVLARDEGYLALVGEIGEIYDEGEPREPPSSARRVVRAFEDNDDLDVLGGGRTEVGGRRATVLDVVPTGDERVPVLGVGESVYYAEVETVTRLLVLQEKGRPFVVILEGANGHDLGALLDHAEPVLGTLTFR